MTEMTTLPAVTAGAPARTRRSGRFERFGRELRYLTAGLPVGIAAYTVIVAGFSVGLGSLALVIGVPVLAWTLSVARWFAAGERRQVETATGRAMPAPHYRVAGPGATLGQWWRALGDPQSWRDLLHAFLAFPLRVTTFCLALTWTVGGLGELLYGTWAWSLPRDEGETGVLDLAFGISSEAADIAFNTGVGIVLLATAVPMVRGLVALQAALARALLTPSGDGGSSTHNPA
ncbi:sensor domain-containing protein [Streptomyces litchfieldiae]|uniref:Sensor domain-containing protein n=1 Tax=Streptomyces litchfieldiae TaxID=3075543 RepID=A0ABU2MKC8_9ACTN|nr:sensor domain-containing protein [Streptomyces sp. DSM 44938]MDT0342066.1 sensor domain-containing protein [Streptomyces sp. DSM 44938]